MNVRRAALSAIAAVTIVLAPTAALAYGPEDFTNDGTVSDTTPGAGESFTVTVEGPANTDVTLTVTTNPASVPDSAITIAGTQALTKTTSADGTAVFTVSVAEDSVVRLVVTDTATGTVISDQTVTVGAGASGTDDGELSSTGSETMPILLGAGALALVGAGALVLARRRRTHQH